MRKLVTSAILLFLFAAAKAQDVNINLFAGSANYSGDLQSRSFTFDQALFTIGLGAGYEFSDKLMLRAGIHYAQLNAQDQYQQNTLRRLRNLSFATNLWEGHIAGEFHFLGMTDRVFSPYAMAGVAVFSYNPYAYAPVSAGGQKVFLRPLSTEGQGLTNSNRSTYSLTQFAIPFGAGVRMKLTDKIGVGAEIGYRKTFTDYLDDVSTSYYDQAALLSQRGPLAVQMAFRTPEVPGHTTDPYPVSGTQRGGSAKDNYYFMTFTLSYRLGQGSGGNGGFSGGRGGGKKHKMGCPTNVW
jgi:Outer membrane protein beta-barrel domain